MFSSGIVVLLEHVLCLYKSLSKYLNSDCQPADIGVFSLTKVLKLDSMD